MTETKKEPKLLRFLWGLFPWLIIIIIIFFMFDLYTKIEAKKTLLEDEKKAAMKNEIPATRVITLTLEPMLLKDKITLPATVEAFEDLWVKSEVSGQVVDVRVNEGESVKEGQTLVKLDDRDYLTRIDGIEANYSQVKQDYERISKLVQRKISAVTDLDKIKTQKKALESQLAEARLALERTKIVAPIRGRINNMAAKKGDWKGVNDEIAQILQYDKVKVTVGVPESDVAAVFTLEEADIVIDALGERRVVGKKKFLSRQPRTLAKLYDLELLVDNPDEKILPGMFAHVELVKHRYPQALTIPLYSVISQGDTQYVYIEKDGKAKRRDVKLGILDEWQVQITDGLNPGDRVIIVGHRMLDDGQSVEIIQNVSNPNEIMGS